MHANHMISTLDLDVNLETSPISVAVVVKRVNCVDYSNTSRRLFHTKSRALLVSPAAVLSSIALNLWLLRQDPPERLSGHSRPSWRLPTAR